MSIWFRRTDTPREHSTLRLLQQKLCQDFTDLPGCKRDLVGRHGFEVSSRESRARQLAQILAELLPC